jgi:hypothetical protein
MLSQENQNSGTGTCRRVQSILQTLLGISLVQTAIWVPTFGVRSCCILLALPCFIDCYFRFPPKSRGSEKRTSGYVTAIMILASIALAMFLGLLFWALDLWSPHQLNSMGRSVQDWSMVKIPTVIIQQIVFQLIILPTLYYATGNKTLAVLASASLFGLFHLPNPLLVVVTLMAGVVWFSVAIRLQNALFPIVVSHLVLAIAIGNLADEYLLDMRVGPVCFQKWPDGIRGASDDQSLWVYPRVLRGEITEITQNGQDITIRGRAYDPLRKKSPAEILVVFGSYGSQNNGQSEWFPQIVHSVNTVSQRGEFQLTVAATPETSAPEIRIFARHRLGWSYPVNHSVRYQALSSDPTGQDIALFPQEFHGNVGHIKPRKNSTDVIGWGFSLQDRNLIDQLLVFSKNRLIPLTIERRKRIEVADYYDDPSLMDCGFIARIPLDVAIDPEESQFYVRSNRGTIERLPIKRRHDVGHHFKSASVDSKIIR